MQLYLRLVKGARYVIEWHIYCIIFHMALTSVPKQLFVCTRGTCENARGRYIFAYLWKLKRERSNRNAARRAFYIPKRSTLTIISASLYRTIIKSFFRTIVPIKRKLDNTSSTYEKSDVDGKIGQEFHCVWSSFFMFATFVWCSLIYNVNQITTIGKRLMCCSHKDVV